MASCRASKSKVGPSGACSSIPSRSRASTDGSSSRTSWRQSMRRMRWGTARRTTPTGIRQTERASTRPPTGEPPRGLKSASSSSRAASSGALGQTGELPPSPPRRSSTATCSGVRPRASGSTCRTRTAGKRGGASSPTTHRSRTGSRPANRPEC
ncbi:hypothetical protein ACFPRL_12870 [Pseudoclavibacter helvolus]